MITPTLTTAVETMIAPKCLQGIPSCVETYDRFCAEWPNGCPVSRECLVRTAEIGLGICLQSFAEIVLPQPIFADYLSKWDALFAAFGDRTTPLFATFVAQRDTLYTYSEINRNSGGADSKHVALYADYEAKRAPLLTEFKSQRDALLIDILLDYYQDRAVVVSASATEAN